MFEVEPGSLKSGYILYIHLQCPIPSSCLSITSHPSHKPHKDRDLVRLAQNNAFQIVGAQ